MVENLKDEELKHHKFSFIWKYSADIKPSFLYKRHEMDGTFPYVSRHIRRLSEGRCADPEEKGASYRDLGQISHYLADFYISAQHHLPRQPEGSLFLRGEN